MTESCVRDLKLAAAFVKSVETGDTLVNFELSELAQMIEGIAKRLDLGTERVAPDTGDSIQERRSAV